MTNYRDAEILPTYRDYAKTTAAANSDSNLTIPTLFHHFILNLDFKYFNMQIRIPLCIFFLSFSFIANCQLNRNDVNSVFSEFLKNSYDGKYVGWSSKPNDSLRLDPTEYIDKVISFKKPFRLVQTDNAYFTKSYRVDSLQIWTDYAFGYVTHEAISYGYVLNRLQIDPQKIHNTYLLIKKNFNWYVLAETNNWFVSAAAYIKWAERYLSDKTRTEGPEYKNNVANNLLDFKEQIKIPR